MIAEILGKPGAGKSTIGAAFIQKNKKKKLKFEKKTAKSKLYKKLTENPTKLNNILLNLLFPKNFYDIIYATDPTFQDTITIDYSDLGRFRPTWNSCFILEEAGIGLNSREYKKLTKESKRFAAMHRHAGCDMVIISQTNDFDKAYRSRAEIVFLAKKIGPVTWYHRIPFSIEVDEDKHEIVEGYFKLSPLVDILESILSIKKKHRYSKFPFLRSQFIWRPAWYKYFDSYIDDFDYPDADPVSPGSPKSDNIDPSESGAPSSDKEADFDLFFT